MMAFSSKAQRLIDAAVAQLADADQRAVWSAWAQSQPLFLFSEKPETPRAGNVLPQEVAIVALGALDKMASQIALKLSDPRLEDDDACDLELDISYIRSLESKLISDLQVATAA